MSLTQTIRGFSELVAKLETMRDELGGAASTSTLRKAARRAWRETLKTTRLLASTTVTGREDPKLVSALRIAVKVPKSGTVVLSVGIKVGKAKVEDELSVYADDADGTVLEVGTITATHSVRDAQWRWHWTEFGNAHQSAHPFIRPAWEQHKNQIFETFRAELAKAIEAIAKRGRV